MGMKKIKKQIKEYAQLEWARGYGAGWDACAASEGVRNEFFEEGVRAERERVIALFKMLSDSEFENGSPNKARAWKDAADIVKVADELEVYDEEGEYLG